MTLRGAEVLTPSGLAQQDLQLAAGKIGGPGGSVVDLSGYLILPGIIDLHGDGFERHLAPRRGAAQDLSSGLRSLDADLAAHGITTAVLAQFYSWEGGMRGPDFAEAVAQALATQDRLTEMLFQLRLEINLIDEHPRVLTLIDRFKVPYVVFNDHLPHAALAKGKRPPRLTGQALKSGRSPEAHLAFMQALHDRREEVAPALAGLAEELRARSILMGSHDDVSAEVRAGFRDLGATVAEFPETKEAALAAKSAGDEVIMGAPNVVRGGSHDKRQSATDLISEGIVDAFVSDYHYPALSRAAFKLVEGGVPLTEAWAFISKTPSRILGLHDRGELASGKRADLVIVAADTKQIHGTICGGVVSFLSGDAAARFIGHAP